MATFRVHRRSGSGHVGEPKTRLIRADRFEYGEYLVFYNEPTGQDREAVRVACFAPGTWSWVKQVSP